ncbi:MAG: glycosyltransferase [Candidatus Moranbacteria bacterium]|nr:glycosyltransferase [Candidatus Moranbacteria bacterium]
MKTKKPKLKILFISRTYPPIVGGMEKISYQLIHSIHKLDETRVKALVNKRGKKFLLPFIIIAVLKGLQIGRKFKIVHLSDAVLAPVGEIIKMVYPKTKVICTVHGLDLTYGYKSKLYYTFNIKALRNLDKIIAVSQETQKEAVKLGVPRDKVTVINNGIDPQEFYSTQYRRKDLVKLIKSRAKNKQFWQKHQDFFEKKDYKFIFTVGRLCKRKGISWFIKKVFANLDKNTIYLIAGAGKEKEKILKSIQEKKLSKRIFFLGFVSEKEKKLLFNTVDLFIQPNIKVPGDMEGFGVTMLEAASCKLPVIASNLEGIKDALTHKENGILIEPKDKIKYIKVINRFLEDDDLRKLFAEKARQYTKERFDWKIIARQYLKEFKS